jgi:hypothetical protein
MCISLGVKHLRGIFYLLKSFIVVAKNKAESPLLAIRSINLKSNTMKNTVQR